jgi:hypothetical protein
MGRRCDGKERLIRKGDRNGKEMKMGKGFVGESRDQRMYALFVLSNY